MTPDELRRRADAMDAEGLKALDVDDRERAVDFFRRSMAYRAAADSLERLHKPRTGATMAPMLPEPTTQPKKRRPGRANTPEREDIRRAKISIAQGGDLKIYEALRSRGYRSLRAFAEDVGVTAPTLSRWVTGVRPIPRRQAERIQKLIGWPADDEHWPGGVAE